MIAPRSGIVAALVVVTIGAGATGTMADDGVAYRTAWAGALDASGRFVASGLRGGNGGFAGPYRARDVAALRREATAFADALDRVERTGAPDGYAAYHRELMPVYRAMHGVMQAIIEDAVSRDPLGLEVGWRRLGLLIDEAAELARLVASAPQRAERPIAAAITAVAAALSAVIAMRGRRRRRAPALPDAPVTAVCGSCDDPLPDGARFCPSCGARVTVRPAKRSRARSAVALASFLVAGGAAAWYGADPGFVAAQAHPSASPTRSDRPTMPPPSTPAPDGLVRYRVTGVTTNLLIRDRPRANARIIGRARNGTVLTGPGRTRRADGHTWVAVYVAERPEPGWASMRYLSEIDGSGGE